MPNLLDALSEEEQGSAHALLNKIVDARGELQIFSEQLDAFNVSLATVTEDNFFTLVDQIIKKEQEIYNRMEPFLAGVETHVLDAVKELLVGDERFVDLNKLLRPDHVLNQHILMAKEKFSEANVYKALDAEKGAEARGFIGQVKSLNLFDTLIDAQKEAWKLKLSTADSVEDVDTLDEAISRQGEMLSVAYKSLVSYPNDEKTSGVLIDYLAVNPHLLNRMQVFDGFYESLQDDILAARMQLARYSNSGP